MRIPFLEEDPIDQQPPEDLDLYDVETIATAPLDDRTAARGIALQILYEKDLAEHHPLSIIIRDRMENVELPSELAEFVVRIVAGTYPNIEIIDNFIVRYAPDWPIDQIAVVDRNIIRIAVWEFAISQMTPLKVAINESVELAKYFGSNSSKRFVHGVLGSLANHIDEIHAAAKIE